MPPGVKVQQVQIPIQVVAQLQMQFLMMAANAVVDGDYDGNEAVPANCKRIIGDMLITMSRNPGLEKAVCEHCGKIRLEHELHTASGNRLCALKEGEDPVLERKQFRPVQPRIIVPGG